MRYAFQAGHASVACGRALPHLIVGPRRPRESSAALPARSFAGEDLTMTDLTALEVQALAALMGGRPMTSAELSRSVSGTGMHVSSQDAAATLRSLAGNGLVERTPAASLGKYRVTAEGRSWLAANTGTGNTEPAHGTG